VKKTERGTRLQGVILLVTSNATPATPVLFPTLSSWTMAPSLSNWMCPKTKLMPCHSSSRVLTWHSRLGPVTIPAFFMPYINATTSNSTANSRRHFIHCKSLASIRHNIVWLQQCCYDYWYVQLTRSALPLLGPVFQSKAAWVLEL
jgi:hypothetical protein